MQLLVEVSGGFDSFIESLPDDFKNLVTAVDDFDSDVLYSPVKDVSLKDAAEIVKVASGTHILAEFDSDKLLILWLVSRNISYELISEYNININDEKYRTYQKIHRYDFEP